MIILLDHDDSFVHTLARYVEELGRSPLVVSARKTTVAEILDQGPSHIILSPGPGRPEACAVALELIHATGGTIPLLGICLGHQCIAIAYGGQVSRAGHPLHGSASLISHDGVGVYAGLPSPLRAARYHALAVDAATVPPDLQVTAMADDGEIMGLRHRRYPVEGVQFHPESVLSDWGHRILANFLGVATSAGQRADALSA